MRLEIICTGNEVLTGKTINARLDCLRRCLQGLPASERAGFEKT